MPDTEKPNSSDENDAGSMQSMSLSDQEDANTGISAIDKLQALVDAAQLPPSPLRDDHDSADEPALSVVQPAPPALSLPQNNSHHQNATTAMLSPNPLSPETPYSASAYYRNTPLSAGGLSSIPSAASNAPLFDRSPSPSANFEIEPSLGLTREMDGSTSALRDVRTVKPGQTTPNDNVSISSETQRKLRPESVLMPLTRDPLILGIALVDFDHAVRSLTKSKCFF